MPSTTAKRLGPYELLARLAKGGMAELFLARRHGASGFTRLVAVKRILPALAREESFSRMFQEEARLAALIHHPNVVQILDLGQEKGTFYLAMELIQGPSVAAMINHALASGARIPWAVAAEIVAQACDGLHAAHELRDPAGHELHLVHRDVGPGNLMVSEGGVVKLVDFGIAKAQDSAFKTRTGTVKGKYPYLSPEMCRGEALDRRADLFALGATFHELLALERLFERDTIYGTIQAITEDPITDVRQVRADVPGPVGDVVRRALEREPDERWPSAEAMASALRDAMDRHGAPGGPRRLAEYLQAECVVLLERRARAVQEVVQRATDRTSGPVMAVHGFDDASSATEPTVTDEIPGPPDPAVPDETDVFSQPTAPQVRALPPEHLDPPDSGIHHQRTAPTRRKLPRRVLLPVLMAGTFVAALSGTLLVRLLLRPASKPVPLRLGLAPAFNRRQVSAELRPFLDYLSQEVGRPVRVVTDLDYEALRTRLVRGTLDLAALPHLQMVLARREQPRPTMVAAMSYKGKATYRSVIVVRDNSGVRTLADLAGKRFCWNDPGSASGFLMPRLLLRGEGIDPESAFAGTRFSGSHRGALKDVIEGRCDATATAEGWLLIGSRMGLATERLRILAVAGTIPLDMVCASPRLPRGTVERLRAALLAFRPRQHIDRDVLGPSFLVDGFAAPDWSTYESFIGAMRGEGILPAAPTSPP